jgi:hypothetical protein
VREKHCLLAEKVQHIGLLLTGSFRDAKNAFCQFFTADVKEILAVKKTDYML